MKLRKKLISMSVTIAMIATMSFGSVVYSSATESATGTIVGGGAVISSGGVYDLADQASGRIDINTTEAVTIRGTDSTVCYNDLTLNALVSGVNLTVQDVYIKNNQNVGSTPVGTAVNAGSNIITLSGGSNTVDVEGTCTFETVQYVSSAGIYVPFGSTLNLSGEGTLYMYKYTQGAGIGGNAGEANGTINFKSGSYFIKGSKSGALIGNDLGSSGSASNLGSISFEGDADVHLINKAQGAAVGGSRASNAGSVYIKDNANVEIITDFSGSAIGAGAQNKGNAGANGNLYISGGSLKTMLTSNAYNEWGVSGSDSYMVTDTAVTANVSNTSAADVYRCVVPAGQQNNEISVDGQKWYSGQTYGYTYTANNATAANWNAGSDPNVYLYLTGEDHLIKSNGSYYVADYNEDSSSFSVSACDTSADSIHLGTPDCTSLSAAISSLGSRAGVIYVDSTVNAGSDDVIALNSNQAIVRGNCTGVLLSVQANTALTLESGMIDGANGSLIEVGNGSFTVNPSIDGSLEILGNVYLADGGLITIGTNGLDELKGVLSVECASPTVDRVIAAGADSESVLEKLVYIDNSWDLNFYRGEVKLASSESSTRGSMSLLGSGSSSSDPITENMTLPSTMSSKIFVKGGTTADSPLVLTVDGAQTETIRGSVIVVISGYVVIEGKNNAVVTAGASYATYAVNYNSTNVVNIEIHDIAFETDAANNLGTGLTVGQIGNSQSELNLRNVSINAEAWSSAQTSPVYIGTKGGSAVGFDNVMISNARYGSYIDCSGTLDKVNISGLSDEKCTFNQGVTISANTINLNPTRNINIANSVTAQTINVTPQEGYPIASLKVNGEAKTVPTASTQITDTVTSGIEIKLAGEEEEASYNAYIANVSAEEIAKDGTFTADVYVKSDSPIDAAQIDLTVQNGTITSIEPAADGIESGNGSISVYNNTADVKDGYKLATVTVKADGTKNDVVLSIADTSTVGISGSPEDYSFTLSDDAQATVSIYKSDKVSCEEYAAGKYLLKYTGEVADGNIAQYNGEDLLYSEKLGAWIAVIDTDVSESVVNNDITTAAGTKESVDYTGDVNLNGTVNIVDAQIAYDIANNVYSDYSIATKPMWFRADANGDGTVKAPDARAIQCIIHGITA